ncbi:MAG TPA: glycosyl hydrolase family 28 protein [Bacillota bacterium]|nr:glycosyl hydrolase family 28 protein [Bacillota bacterium]
MKRRILFVALALLLALTCTACSNNEEQSRQQSEPEISQTEETGMDKPVVYSVPNGEEKSIDYVVTAWTEKNGEKQSVDCFTAKVGTQSNGTSSVSYETMSFCTLDYDFSSTLYISVTPSQTHSSAKVLPASAGAEYEYKDEAVTLSLNKPSNLSVEFDGDINHNLFVFAGEYDEDKPKSGDRGVIYYGAGTHDVGEIKLNSNQTLYIDGGAVVYGYVKAENADNISIMGSGILDGSKVDHAYTGSRKRMVSLVKCTNVTIDGVTVRDASTWGVVLDRCSDVTVTNHKQISYNFNSDGFDILSCTNVLIDGAFLRNYDDNISLKAYNNTDCTGITMRNSTLWADCAHNMLIGPEAKEAEYENKFSDILFYNIDVLESKENSDFYRGVMAITCTDNGVFDGITWDTIRVERMTKGRLINFRYSNDYGTYFGKSVSNITIKNITCSAKTASDDYIYGNSASPMKNIVIENFTYLGEKVTHDRFEKCARFVTLTVDKVEKEY